MSLIHHHIETTPDVSVRTRPYRMPEHKNKLVQAEIRAMLELGVIEESHSAWSSPILLVGKPEGSIRFCVDYRKVNNVSRFDVYPMPRVDESAGHGLIFFDTGFNQGLLAESLVAKI